MRSVLQPLFPERRASIAATLLSLLLVVACTDNGDEGADPAPDRTADAGLTAKTFFPIVSKAMMAAGSASVELEVASASGVLRTRGVQLSGEDPSTRRLKLTTTLDGQRVSSVRVIGRTAFVQDQQTDGRFVRLDLDHLSPSDAQLFGSIADQRTLSEQFEELQAAVTRVERQADLDRVLDGVETDAYAVTVAVDRLDAGAELARQGFRKVRYGFWIGPDRLPRRMVVDVSGTKVVSSYRDWGREVEVEPPPATQVVEDDELD